MKTKKRQMTFEHIQRKFTSPKSTLRSNISVTTEADTVSNQPIANRTPSSQSQSCARPIKEVKLSTIPKKLGCEFTSRYRSFTVTNRPHLFDDIDTEGV